MLIHLFWIHCSRYALFEKKNQVYAIFSDEFMTKPILDSIGMNDTFIFYDHFHLKNNLDKALLSKWIVLKPCIDLIFTANDDVVLIDLYKQTIRICKESNSSALILVKLMNKKIIGLRI